MMAAVLLAGTVYGDGARGTIIGTVVEEGTGEPLGHALVRIVGQPLGAIADEGGGFVIGSVAEGVYVLEASLVGYEGRRSEGIAVSAGKEAKVELRLAAMPIPLRETVVTPGRFVIMKNDPAAGQKLTKEEIHSIPQLGEDIYQAIKRLPGVSSKDYSARFTVRGGEHDEVLVLLDGLEVYEPFHLKDIGGGAFSAVDVMAIGGIDMMTGGFPARYGNHMSGVLDITSVEPQAERRTALGISFMNARLLTDGQFDGGRGSWLLSARRGYLDIVMKMVDASDISPVYYDVLSKVEYRLNDRHILSVHVLHADDHLSLEEDGDFIESRYGNSYGWLRLRSTFGPGVSGETVASVGIVSRERLGEDKSDVWDTWGQRIIGHRVRFSLDEERRFSALGLKQDWNWEVSERHLLMGGVDVKYLDSRYDYFNQKFVFAGEGSGPVEGRYDTMLVAERPEGFQLGVYAEGRYRPVPQLIAEVGVRYDRLGYTGDEDVSPRLNLAWNLGERTVLRGGWGFFFQGQDIGDLDVPYGDATFYRSQKAEHRVAGIEHGFGNGLNLRVEVYQKRLEHIRPRHENLSRDVLFAPELSEVSVFLEPVRGEAKGLEIYLRRDTGGRLTWWGSYALAWAEEEFAERVVAKNEDQRHTVYFDGNFRPNRKWRFNLAWQYRSGWPFTERRFIRIDVPEGEWPFRDGFGPRNGVRLPAYHRLDLRVNRYFYLEDGRLSIFAEIINAYDRENVMDVRPGDRRQLVDGELVATDTVEDEWLPLMPSIGVSWEF